MPSLKGKIIIAMLLKELHFIRTHSFRSENATLDRFQCVS